MPKAKQTERILKYLDDFGSITQLEAMNDLGCMHLASRISDLRKLGYPIIGMVEAVRNRYGETCYIKRYYFSEGRNADVQEQSQYLL